MVYSLGMTFSRWRALLVGLLIWGAGTIAIRIIGQQLLRPKDTPRILWLYFASFFAMMLVVRLICRWLALERTSWMGAAGLLVLPTLILDSFTCVFFADMFPNIDPSAAGIFGGWMLICCGGGIAGALAGRADSEAD